MGSFADYLELELLDHVLKVGSYGVPANIYVALYTAAPSDAGGGTEVTGSGYARVAHNTWDAAAGGASSNSGAVSFGTAASAWGTVTHFALLDATTAGNFLMWGTLDSSRVIATNDTCQFADGALDITLD